MKYLTYQKNYFFVFFIVICMICNTGLKAQEYSFDESIKELRSKIENAEVVGSKVKIYCELIELCLDNNYSETLNYIIELNDIANANNNFSAESYSNLYFGRYYLNNNDYQKAKDYFLLALNNFQKLDDKSNIGLIYNRIGLCYQYLNQYDDALSYYQKAIEIFEQIGNKEQAAVSFIDIGTLYNDIEKYSLSQFYYEKALDIYLKTDNKERVAAIYQNLGVLQYNWGNLNESIEFYQKSLEIYKSLKDKRCIAISLSNIGLVYEENERYIEAKDYYEKALLMFEDLENQQMLVYIFYNIGSIYRNLAEYNKSIDFFNKGLDLSLKLKMKDYISYNYEALSGVYEDLKQYKKSLDYYKDYIFVKDSIFNENHLKDVADLELKYQNAKKQKEIEFLKLNESIKDSELAKKEAQNLVLFISGFLVSILAFIIFIFFRSQRRAAKKLEIEVLERKKSENALKILTENLEQRVEERTSEIVKINDNLKREIKDHKTTAKRLEIAKNQAEESDRIKSGFLANISHEVRTPLNAILGFSQMFENENLTVSKRRSYITKIKMGCKSLTNLIDDIIDYASIEAGEAKIEKKEFNPHPTFEYLHDHYADEILKLGKESLVLRFDNENSDGDLKINTDPVRLKQIMSILLDNAIKFTETGSIDFGFVVSNNGDIDFYVKDTGIGIDKKHADVVFERFRQLEEYATRTYGGTGIGLSVAKSLVRMLEGKIWFESTVGVGTTFYVKLPCSINNPAKEIESISEKVDFYWYDKVILVAEDKEINYEIIKETLSITEAKLLWAKNGQEALDIVQSNEKIDLILMDIQMPVMNGYETTQRIKAYTSEIPVIAHTAYALKQDNIKCFEAGCDDYISKPISLNLFLNKLNKYLS